MSTELSLEAIYKVMMLTAPNMLYMLLTIATCAIVSTISLFSIARSLKKIANKKCGEEYDEAQETE